MNERGTFNWCLVAFLVVAFFVGVGLIVSSVITYKHEVDEFTSTYGVIVDQEPDIWVWQDDAGNEHVTILGEEYELEIKTE